MLTLNLFNLSLMNKKYFRGTHMVKLLQLGFILAFTSACSTTKTVKETKDLTPEGEPQWLYEPSQECTAIEMCASGQGEDMEEADAHARKSLAGVFETKINSEFQVTKHSLSNQEVEELEEKVSDMINEQVNTIIKGVYIKHHFQKGDIFFSHAALDKNKVSRVLREELSRIDSELTHYYSLKNKLYVKKLNILFNEREVLNEKLAIVNGAGVPRKVSFDDINNLKYINMDSAISLIARGDIPSVLEKKLNETFNSVGYRIVDDKSDYNIYMEYSSKEEYLNVKGFKKYTYELSLDARNATGKQVGSFIVTKISNGRSETDAFSKVRNAVINEVTNNIEKLNLN